MIRTARFLLRLVPASVVGNGAISSSVVVPDCVFVEELVVVLVADIVEIIVVAVVCSGGVEDDVGAAMVFDCVLELDNVVVAVPPSCDVPEPEVIVVVDGEVGVVSVEYVVLTVEVCCGVLEIDNVVVAVLPSCDVVSCDVPEPEVIVVVDSVGRCCCC